MKRRTINPDFFSDTKTGRLNPVSQIIFIGMWCLADRDGYLEYDSDFIKCQILPYYKNTIEKNIEELISNGLVIKCNYMSKQLLYIVNFTKHQPIHPHEAKSLYPPIDSEDVIKCNDMQVHPNSKGIGISKGKDRDINIYIKPNIEEIEKYCLEKNLKVDAKKFFDYFEAGNWIDSKGNKVRNWKQKILTWENHSKKEQSKEIKDYTEENKKKIDAISSTALKFTDCYNTLVKLSKDNFIGWGGNTQAESFIKDIHKKPLTDNQITFIESILIKYVKG